MAEKFMNCGIKDCNQSANLKITEFKIANLQVFLENNVWKSGIKTMSVLFFRNQRLFFSVLMSKISKQQEYIVFCFFRHILIEDCEVRHLSHELWKKRLRIAEKKILLPDITEEKIAKLIKIHNLKFRNLFLRRNSFAMISSLEVFPRITTYYTICLFPNTQIP